MRRGLRPRAFALGREESGSGWVDLPFRVPAPSPAGRPDSG